MPCLVTYSAILLKPLRRFQQPLVCFRQPWFGLLICKKEHQSHFVLQTQQ